MSRVVFTGCLVAAGLVACVASASSVIARSRALSQPATTAQDLYCTVGAGWGYPGNCQYATYEQCMASASGTDAYCSVNPVHGFAGYRSSR